MHQTLYIRPRYYRWFVEPGVEWVETNTGYAHLDWEIPIEQCGLVLVDVWDGHYLKDTDSRSEQIIQGNIRPLLSACRKSGLQLIHAPSPDQAKSHPAWVGPIQDTSHPPCEKRDWPPTAFRRKSEEYSHFAKPMELRQPEIDLLRADRQIHPDAQPEGSDVVIATGDELHRYCHERQILFLFYLGFNTNACILLRDYGTVEMSKRGYEIIIVRDCTTGMESFETHDALGQTRGSILFLEMFGKYSITSPELIGGLP